MGESNPIVDLMQYRIGGDPKGPFALQAPTLGELLLKSAGGVLNPNRGIPVSGVGGRLLGGASRLVGGVASGFGESMEQQRLDPLQRQLAIAKATLAQANQPQPIIDPNSTFQQEPPDKGMFAPAPVAPGQMGYAPTIKPPAPPPFANMTPEQFVMAAINPLAAEAFSPGKQAQLRNIESEMAFRQGPQTQLTQSQIRENESQIANRNEAAQRLKDQDAADAEFTRQYNAARQSNPTATINQLAGLAGEIAARTGASDKAVKPIMDAFGTAGQLTYHQESIKVRREEIAAQQSQFRQSLDRGDTNTARQIVADEVRSHQAVIKETESRIKASEKLLSDPLVSQADKAAIKAQIAADKEQLDKVDRAALKDAQGRLRNLFAGTRAGQQVIAREPPAPPPGAAPPAARQPQPRTLEEYRRLRGG